MTVVDTGIYSLSNVGVCQDMTKRVAESPTGVTVDIRVILAAIPSDARTMLTRLFQTTHDLTDLGECDERLRGIFSPTYDDGVVQRYLHEQFLDGAESYLQKYQNTEHWRCLLSDAVAKISASPTGDIRVLDIGSGGGNTVFPLLDLFPKAAVVATDLSIPLLRAVRQHADMKYADRFCYTLQLNAEEIFFADDQFDLVVGAAVLHHLFQPEQAIREVARILKTGGIALFFEPFEIGNQIIVNLLRQLLSRDIEQSATNERERISGDIRSFFQRLDHDFCIRKDPDKSKPEFASLDDRWTFTRTYFEKVASANGLELEATYNLYPSPRLFANHLNTYLSLGLGKNLTALPTWAQEEVALIDDLFSDDARNEVFVEGGIILRKPPNAAQKRA